MKCNQTKRKQSKSYRVQLFYYYRLMTYRVQVVLELEQAHQGLHDFGGVDNSEQTPHQPSHVVLGISSGA